MDLNLISDKWPCSIGRLCFNIESLKVNITFKLKPQAAFMDPRLAWIAAQCIDQSSAHIGRHGSLRGPHLSSFIKSLWITRWALTHSFYFPVCTCLSISHPIWPYFQIQSIGHFCGFAVRRPLKLLQKSEYLLMVCFCRC